MSTQTYSGVPFEEKQKFRQPWVWGLLAAPLIFAPVSAPLVLVEGSVMALFLVMELTVRVEPDALSIRFVPFAKRRIPYGDIRACYPRTYSPLGEYGGWGVRGLGKNRAYNVSGNRGVQLELANGERIMLGSQDPEALAAAINRQRGV